MSQFALLKFAPNGMVYSLSEPMAIYNDWPSTEAAALLAQQQYKDGTQIVAVEGVAITSYTSPPVVLTLLGATVPTTV